MGETEAEIHMEGSGEVENPDGATAAPDMSEEEKTLMKALKAFNLSGKKLNTDLFMKALETEGEEDTIEDITIKYEDEHWGSDKSTVKGTTLTTPHDHDKDFKSYHYPKLLKFYGEDGKGEASWPKFKYDLEELIKDNVYTEEQLMFGIRRAMLGKAGEKLTRMGHGMTVKKVISKFESEYGLVDTRETVLGKFFNCKQQSGESITDYAARVEELYSQAVKLGGVTPKDETSLQNVLFAGLSKDFSLRAAYKHDTIKDYDKFKLELRKIENELKLEKAETKKCNVAMNMESREKSEMSQVKDLLEKMNARIDKIEKEKNDLKEQLNQQQYQRPNMYYNFNRGANTYRTGQGYRGRGNRPFRGQGRGNEQYEPQRPVASNMFSPRRCFKCNQTGHLMRNCPKV